MATNYLQTGRVITHSPTDDIKSGQIVAIGAVPAVALADVLANTPGEFQTSGVWMLPKAPGLAIAQGTPLVFDAGNGTFTTAAPGPGDISGAAWAYLSANGPDAEIAVCLPGVAGTVAE